MPIYRFGLKKYHINKLMGVSRIKYNKGALINAWIIMEDILYSILIVEGDEMLSSKIKRILIKEGFSADVVRSGKDAISYMADRQNVIMLLDSIMPDMNATGLMENLSSRSINVPFVIMTDPGNEKMILNMMEMGAREYLLKNGNYIHLMPGILKKTVMQLNNEKRTAEKENSLSKTVNRYQNLADTVSLSIMLLGNDGSISYVNKMTESYFGYLKEELIGRNIRDLVPDYFDKRFTQWRDECINNPQKNSESDLIARRKDGTSFFVTIIMSYFKDENDSYTLCLINDITESKQTERELVEYKKHLEQVNRERTSEIMEINKLLKQEIRVRKIVEQELLKATEMAEKANKAKSEFLANMTHELRTPLNSVIGFAKLMRRSNNPDLYEKRLNNILTSSEHLLSLINDLLDISKIEAGKMDFKMEVLPINETIMKCINLISVLAKEKNIAVGFIKNIKDDAVINGDRKGLEQVFLNLLSNAVKFTPAGGRVDILSNLHENFLVIEIIDNGIGINSKHLDYIFEKFTQIKTGLMRGNEGTGLGLPISKKIIDAHGGNISVRSQEGLGSTFIVKIPRNISNFQHDSSSEIRLGVDSADWVAN